MLRIRRPKETFTLIAWAIYVGVGLLGGWLVMIDVVIQIVQKLF